MIGDREQVYENIRTAVSLNQLNSKVEPGDPKLLREDKEALLRHYIDYRTAYGFCVKKYIFLIRNGMLCLTKAGSI